MYKQAFPNEKPVTFHEWVANQFGERLFSIFFKTYTEKVWGIPCSELRAEWAAQRIKDLSLRSAVVAMFVKPRTTIKTLIEEFDYPRLGPGMMWRATADEIRRAGGEVRLGAEVIEIRRTGRRVDGVVVTGPRGEEPVRGDQFLSSMPVTDLVLRLSPPAPDAVREAARRLTYRDFLTVCLIVDRPDPFPDNWIYVHSPEVKVGRIQNFRSWSPDMVPDPTKGSLGLEYFCSEGDALWTMADAELIRLGKEELERIGLARASEISDGCVFRVPKAYPVYDADYREHLDTVRGFVDGLENLQTIGRNGLHRYNNQDHAMLTGLLAVRNLEGGARHDLWSVNTEPEYHEEIGISDAEAAMLDGRVTEIFPRVDGVAFGAATGLVAGALLCLATLVLVWKGGPVVGPTLGLLAQFLPGYSVTATGAMIGLIYGALGGFLAGWSFAVIRNLTLFFSLSFLRRRAQRQLLKRFLEFV
jgi:protoporphyrinogen oxidase